MMMKTLKTTIVSLGILSLVACGGAGGGAETASAESSATARTETASTETTATSSTTAALEESADIASRFGFNHIRGDSYDTIAALGGRWERPHPGPVVWGAVESSPGEYSWDDVDTQVALSQAYDMNLLITIWPYADWDQESCHSTLASLYTAEFTSLGDYRQQACDLDALSTFLTALAERYDGDGVDDMEGLLYPVHAFEIANEPAIALESEGSSVFYSGTAAEYYALLSTAYAAIHAADANAVVLHAGMYAQTEIAHTFWGDVFALGGDEVLDVTNYHSITNTSDDVNMGTYGAFLSEQGVAAATWVTELEFSEAGYGDTTEDEAAAIVVKAYVGAFASGAAKIFMAGPEYDQSGQGAGSSASDGKGGESSAANPFALVDSNGDTTAVYSALATLIAYIDRFSAVATIDASTYAFTVDGETVTVSWSSGEITYE
jgi:hypothetical protein